MSILPPGMDGSSMNGGALQDWQQNVAETLARTEPRTARRTRGGLQGTVRTVTPEQSDDNAMFEISSSSQTSPRNIPGGERPKDKRQGLLFNESYSTDSLESAPRNGPPVSFNSQARPRTRTLEEPGRNRSTSNNTATSRNRLRIGSVSSSLHDVEPKSPPNSWKSNELPGIPAKSPSQLRKSGSKKEKGKRLVKRSRPPSPIRVGQDVPSIDSLTYPVTTEDANKILILMKTLCGRMKGEVEFQSGNNEPWQEGTCYIDDINGALIYEQDENGPLQVPLIHDLRGYRVRLTTLRQKQGKCLEVISPAGIISVRMIPTPAIEYDLWLAALLCFQQIRSGAAVTSPRVTAPPTLERPELPRRDNVNTNPGGNIIKVAKLLLWDKGAPDTPAAVVKRPSTREIRSATRAWRRVSCILQDNGEFKLLTENDVTLLSVILLSQLSRCAIQRIDKSVLGEEHCIGILPQYAPNATQLSIFRPIYIALETRLLMEVWYCLLRAFCIPEIYGPQQFDEDGSESSLATPGQGMFRIEKSISVRITEAKIRLPANNSDRPDPPYTGKSKSEPDPSIGDYLAEVILDGEVRARTMTKTETRNPFWREDYEFHDLPPYLPRASLVFKRIEQQVASRAMLSSSSVQTADHGVEVICGTVDIMTETLERGKDVEKWCEIRNDQQQSIGELFLKIRHDEFVVLMARDYQPISELLHNFGSGLTQEIAQTMPTANLKKLTEILMNIFQVSGHAAEWLMTLVEDEIDGVGRDVPLTHRLRWSRRMGSNESFGSSSDREQTVRAMGRSLDNEANLLFRGNSLLTQSLDFHMRRLGKEYLEEVLSEKITAINSLNPDCEVDPSRVSDGDDINRNWTSLIALTTDVWDGIADSPNRCPAELRQLLKYIRSCAEDRFGNYLRSAPYTSISGFLFLRYFCPAILNPKLFGLLPDHAQPKAQRTLTLIAKSLQALANLSQFGQKEAWMEPMNRFLNAHRNGLKDFLDEICSIPSERNTFALPASYSTPITILARLPPTSREGFPSLPYLIDHARNFAALINLWLASAPADLDTQEESDLHDFHHHCLTLQRRTDECLALASSHPDRERRLSLHWDDVIDSSSLPTTPAPEVDLPPLSRDEAENLSSPHWAEYTSPSSHPHSQEPESEASHVPTSPRDHGPSSEIDKDIEDDFPSPPSHLPGQYYTPPTALTEGEMPTYSHVATLTRPTTATSSTPSYSGSQRGRKSKDRKRHSLTLGAKEKDRDRDREREGGHKSAVSELGLGMGMMSPLSPPMSSPAGSGSGIYRDRDRAGGRKEKEKEKGDGKQSRGFLGLTRRKKDDDSGKREQVGSSESGTGTSISTSARSDPQQRDQQQHLGDGIRFQH